MARKLPTTIPQNAPLGYPTFPGVLAASSATYTLLHGITPGSISMQIAPQDSNLLQSQGDVQFIFGQTTLTFKDCRVDNASLRYDLSGAVVSLSILDRRWKWAFGEISGQYNQREFDNTILPLHEKRPQELAQLCLDAMGETGYDVTHLPDDTRPATTWVAAVPMRVLADLCEQLGCRVVLKLDGTVLIARPGVGTDLPEGSDTPIDNFGQSIDLPERPDKLVVLCSMDRIQVDLPLEALAKDVDGSIKTIDEVSYAPAAGWLGVVPGNCEQIPRGPARDLAIETYLRWYGITAQNLDFSNPLQLPVFGPVYTWRQLTALQVQVQKYIENDGSVRPVPALLYGSFCSGELKPFESPPITFGDTPGTAWTLGFSLDSATGVVSTNTYAFAIDDSGNLIPADLVLRTSVNVVDYQTWAPSRHQRAKDYGTTLGTQPRFLLHDEIEYQVLPIYGEDGSIQSFQDNNEEVDAEADYYLQAADLEYQTPMPKEIGYIGLIPISPDGAIQQVTWSVGVPGGAKTRAGRNSEFSTVIPPYRSRRRFEQLHFGFLNQIKQAVGANSLMGLVPGKNGLSAKDAP